MEQLIRAATPYNYAMLAFLFFGVGSICFEKVYTQIRLL